VLSRGGLVLPRGFAASVSRLAAASHQLDQEADAHIELFRRRSPRRPRHQPTEPPAPEGRPHRHPMLASCFPAASL